MTSSDKLLRVCPVCNSLHSVIKNKFNRGSPSPLIASGAKMEWLRPERCKNPVCQKLQEDRRNDASLLQVSYQQYKTERGLKEPLNIRFPQLGPIKFNCSYPSMYDHVFSNFVPHTIVVDGLPYPTVEHAYQAAKCVNEEDRERIRLTQNPGAAKRMGRKVQIKPNWEEIKYQVMVDLLKKKFTTNLDFQSVLLNTGSAAIVEVADLWNDTEWGVGKEGLGKNLLGKALMEVRSWLQEKREQEKKEQDKQGELFSDFQKTG